MGRVAGSFFLIGALITVASLLFPHSPQADLTGFWALAGASACGAALLLARPERLPVSAYFASMLAASVLVAVAIYFNGERHGGPAAINEVLYLWIALYSGYFFSRAQIVVQLLLVAGSYAVVLIAIAPGPVGFTRWFIVVAMMSTATVVIHLLKRRNDDLVARLTRAARSDPLTGLLNRKGFNDRFELELERARRKGSALALVLGDLDGLKNLNDRYGHAAGDRSLQRVASVLRRIPRKVDAAARIGGDEFALILPSAGSQTALTVTSRLRAGLSPASGDGAAVTTMSFGIVEFPLHGATAEQLMHAADQALYAAKRSGRDRAVVHPSQPPLDRSCEAPGIREPVSPLRSAQR